MLSNHQRQITKLPSSFMCCSRQSSKSESLRSGTVVCWLVSSPGLGAMRSLDYAFKRQACSQISNQPRELLNFMHNTLDLRMQKGCLNLFSKGYCWGVPGCCTYSPCQVLIHQTSGQGLVLVGTSTAAKEGGERLVCAAVMPTGRTTYFYESGRRWTSRDMQSQAAFIAL